MNKLAILASLFASSNAFVCDSACFTRLRAAQRAAEADNGAEKEAIEEVIAHAEEPSTEAEEPENNDDESIEELDE